MNSTEKKVQTLIDLIYNSLNSAVFTSGSFVVDDCRACGFLVLGFLHEGGLS